jgi:hypothetical protein
MSKNTAPLNDDEELLRAFADLLDDVIPEDPDDIESLLKEVGLDPREIESKTRALIHQARASTPLDWRNKRAQMKAVLDQHEKLGNQLPSDRKSLMEIWQQLTSKRKASALTAHFRNQKPEAMTDEELRSLIKDALFVLGSKDSPDTELGQ